MDFKVTLLRCGNCRKKTLLDKMEDCTWCHDTFCEDCMKGIYCKDCDLELNKQTYEGKKRE